MADPAAIAGGREIGGDGGGGEPSPPGRRCHGVISQSLEPQFKRPPGSEARQAAGGARGPATRPARPKPAASLGRHANPAVAAGPRAHNTTTQQLPVCCHLHLACSLSIAPQSPLELGSRSCFGCCSCGRSRAGQRHCRAPAAPGAPLSSRRCSAALTQPCLVPLPPGTPSPPLASAFERGGGAALPDTHTLDAASRQGCSAPPAPSAGRCLPLAMAAARPVLGR